MTWDGTAIAAETCDFTSVYSSCWSLRSSFGYVMPSCCEGGAKTKRSRVRCALTRLVPRHIGVRDVRTPTYTISIIFKVSL